MSTAILIFTGISVLIIIFELVQIVAALDNMRETLDIIQQELVILKRWISSIRNW